MKLQYKPKICTNPSYECTIQRTEGPEEMRDQIRQEIENKSKLCANPTYECSLQRIDGYEYCLRHILRDQSGNFRQCSYIYLNGRKCPNALPKYDLKKDPSLTTYCFQHSRDAQLIKTRAAVGKLRFVESNEVLLNNLSHHLNTDDLPETVASQCEQEEEIDVVSPHIAPFMPHEQTNEISKVIALSKKKRRILDYASDSSTELSNEPVCLKNTTRGYDYDESDNESIDSVEDDPLKNAEIYTREEVIRISEQKLTRLRKLYLGQVQRLNYILRERRRQYLLALRKEREMLCSIHDQVKETQAERMLYKQLKAYSSYHHRHGIEAVLYKKFKEKRARECNTVGPKAPLYVKCAFTEGGVKCIGRVIPCCKYCRKHILEDKKQTLFRACGVEKSGVVCQDPIPSIFDDSTCVLHLPFPPRRFYTQKKYESETDEDDGSAAAAAAAAGPALGEIKIEKSEEAESTPAIEASSAQSTPDIVKKEDKV